MSLELPYLSGKRASAPFVAVYHDTIEKKGVVDGNTLCNLGIAFLDEGVLTAKDKANWPNDALSALTEAVRVNPDHADAWFYHGKVNLMLGRPGEAVQSFRRAISLNFSKTAEAYYQLATAYLDLKDTHSAILTAIKAVLLNHHHSDARFLLGNLTKDLQSLVMDDAEVLQRAADILGLTVETLIAARKAARDTTGRATATPRPHWKDFRLSGEELAGFIKRKFETELADGTMVRSMLNRYRGLYQDFYNHRDKMPPELQRIPTKSRSLDRQVVQGKLTPAESIRSADRDRKRIAAATRRAAL